MLLKNDLQYFKPETVFASPTIPEYPQYVTFKLDSAMF